MHIELADAWFVSSLSLIPILLYVPLGAGAKTSGPETGHFNFELALEQIGAERTLTVAEDSRIVVYVERESCAAHSGASIDCRDIC